MGYIISLGVGFGVGLLYWLLKVQSPAPPLIALAGLLGMVLGEHAIPVVKAQLFAQTSTTQVAGQTKDGVAQQPATPGATRTAVDTDARRLLDDAHQRSTGIAHIAYMASAGGRLFKRC
jgi:XapX domain-containing protein